MPLPAFAAERRAVPHATAARLPVIGLCQSCSSTVAMGQTDRQTDRRTPDSCIVPAPHTMRAVPTNTNISTSAPSACETCLQQAGLHQCPFSSRRHPAEPSDTGRSSALSARRQATPAWLDSAWGSCVSARTGPLWGRAGWCRSALPRTARSWLSRRLRGDAALPCCPDARPRLAAHQQIHKTSCYSKKVKVFQDSGKTRQCLNIKTSSSYAIYTVSQNNPSRNSHHKLKRNSPPILCICQVFRNSSSLCFSTQVPKQIPGLCRILSFNFISRTKLNVHDFPGRSKNITF